MAEVLIKGLPRTVYDAVWRTGFFTGPNTARNHWKCLRAALELLADVEAKYPGSPAVAHERVNRLGEALKLSITTPQVTARAPATLSVSNLAVACIAAMPSRVDFDTPYGSACTEAWITGHRTFAATSPPWRRGLPAFERAAKAANNAPRTHAEARLKTRKFHHALIAAGREAPWFAAAKALESQLHPMLRSP